MLSGVSRRHASTCKVKHRLAGLLDDRTKARCPTHSFRPGEYICLNTMKQLISYRTKVGETVFALTNYIQLENKLQ